MKKELFCYLKSLGFENMDLDLLELKCPELKKVSSDSAFDCINLLTIHGYPEDDLSFLLAINPKILLYKPKTLMNIINDIGDDFEEKLKENPFLL